MSILGGIEVGEAAATIWSLIREGRILNLIKRFKGGPAPAKESEPLKADEEGKDLKDEVLFLLAWVTGYAKDNKLNTDRRLEEADLNAFLSVIKHYNDLGKIKAVKILTRLIGHKGDLETIKSPKGTKTVGKGAKAKTETVYGEYQRDINPNGARMLVFFGTIGAAKAIELLDGTHLLDNKEDTIKAAAKETKEYFSKLLRDNAQGVEEGAAWFCLGPKGFERAMKNPTIKALRESAAAEADPAAKETKVKLYLEALEKHVDERTSRSTAKRRRSGMSLEKRLAWILLALLGASVGSCTVISAVQQSWDKINLMF